MRRLVRRDEDESNIKAGAPVKEHADSARAQIILLSLLSLLIGVIVAWLIILGVRAQPGGGPASASGIVKRIAATEVRTLAQRSASAAKEIKILIDDTVDRVEAGSSLVQQAGATMGRAVCLSW